ncbi:MAG: DUF3795 domain-containing protein [Dehalococcoidia bacterium]|nr:DUF3795 domain-containing protein [Dehalococcoidia bacterium]MDD5494499.1 DUF3795 domain-containing protein [Dehalococcoidia bacterium]
MSVKKELAAPCGLYCGVCGIYIATRDNNDKFKERLAPVYNTTAEELVCDGCLSERVFGYCKVCPIKSCCSDKKIEGCFQCTDFPCKFIDDFSIPVGKKVILRAVPRWREIGTEKWMEEEDKRYVCPHCSYPTFRGAKRCRECKNPIDLD